MSLFSRYTKLAACESGVTVNQYYDVDAGKTLTSIDVTVSSLGLTLLQVGYYDGTTHSPKYTCIIPYGVTTTAFYPNYINDGSQQVWISVNNVSLQTQDVYLDVEGSEA